MTKRIKLGILAAILLAALVLLAIATYSKASANAYEAGVRAGIDNVIEAQAALSSGEASEHGAVHGSPAHPASNIHDTGSMWPYHHRSCDHTFGNFRNATSIDYKVHNSQIINSQIAVDKNGGRRGCNTNHTPWRGKIHQECAGNLNLCGRKHIHRKKARRG